MIKLVLKFVNKFFSALFVWFVFKPLYCLAVYFRGTDYADKQADRFIQWLERTSTRLKE